MYNLALVERFAHGARAGLLELFMLNPLAVLITAYRCITVSGLSFPWSPAVFVALAVIGLLFLLSLRVYERAQRHFADLL
jgi:ABC-type polysaccharide/polyol phosphate export permease